MEMEAPGFWDDADRANNKMKELKNLKDTVEECNGLLTQYDDILTLIEMGLFAAAVGAGGIMELMERLCERVEDVLTI